MRICCSAETAVSGTLVNFSIETYAENTERSLKATHCIAAGAVLGFTSVKVNTYTALNLLNVDRAVGYIVRAVYVVLEGDEQRVTCCCRSGLTVIRNGPLIDVVGNAVESRCD